MLEYLLLIILAFFFFLILKKNQNRFVYSQNQLLKNKIEFEKEQTHLKTENAQLNTVLDSMQEGVMVLDENQKIQRTNPALLRLFSEYEITLGKSPLECLRHVNLQKMLDELFAKALPVESEIVFDLNAKRVFRVYLNLLQKENIPYGAIAVFQDTTQIKKLEQVRREFVANASHELKTPLAAIKGYTETLLSGAYQNAEHAVNFLGIIDKHANRLNAIIQDLLDLSKIESLNYKLKIEHINPAVLLEELRSTFHQACSQKNINLTLSLDIQQKIWADAVALRQIFSNLLENAIKYSHEGSKVQVVLHMKSDTVVFEIKDNGPGIAPAHLDRLFERFYRVDPSRSREEGGTGLGLSIVKHLVQLHGGKVWVESHLGEGASFFVELPQKGMI